MDKQEVVNYIAIGGFATMSFISIANMGIVRYLLLMGSLTIAIHTRKGEE